MSSPLLTCPLCSQPGFQTLESLRFGLISAATRQVVCPVCHDILFGLDKFTIHLFSHSVQQQQHQAGSRSVPVPMSSFSSPTAPPEQQRSSPPQTDDLLVCAQTDFNTEVNNMKECPISNCHTSISCGECQPASSGCWCKEMRMEDMKRMENVGDKQSSMNPSDTTEARRKFQTGKPDINVVQEKQLSINNLDCKFTASSQSSNVPLLGYAQSSSESVPVQTAKKSSKTVSESMETSQMSIIGNNSSPLDSKALYSPYHYSAGSAPKATHQNASVQCPALSSTPSQDKSTPVVPEGKEVKEVVRCDICGFAFDDSSILGIHHQLVHSMESGSETPSHRMDSSNGSKQGRPLDERRQFPCHLCSKAFKMRGSLMVHLRVAHSSGIAPGKLFIKRLDPDSHSEERKFSCHICSKSFKKEQHLQQHLKTHESKQWECDVCSKLFTTKYFLKKHKRLHTGETPYSCDTCGKTFTFQQSYHKHLLYHSDDKPHVCTECDRAFKELSTLHNHQRIHTGEKPFVCETCGKCFRQRVSYLVHRRIHTGAMPYQCTACGKSFRYKVSQRTHKCLSQPPGTVVRQSNDLVQKLLQGVQQRAAPASSQMPATHMSISSSDSGETVDTEQPLTAQKISGDSHHFPVPQQENQHQQFNNSQFTIIVGSNVSSVFPAGQILLASNGVYDAASLNTHVVCSVSSENSEMEQRSDTQKMREGTEVLNNKINVQSPPKPVVVEVTMATADFKDKQENHEGAYIVQDDNINLNVGNVRNTTDCNVEVSSLNAGGSQEELSLKKTSNKNNMLSTGKKLAQDSVFLEASDFHISAKDELQISSCSSADFWKSSDKICKEVENSDLTVETTDFFTMVTSPSVKSLPSPSEKLKHLTLSSPVDTLLGYDDDVMYHYLLSSADMSVQTNQKKTTDSSSNESSASSTKTSQCEEHGTKPLQTINEESLKHLLYGTASS